MGRQQRKLATTATAKSNNLDHLFVVLRAELGPDWGCYKELLEGAVIAKANGENPSAWIAQIEPLVQKPASQFAHQGVLYLLIVTVRSEAPSTIHTAFLPPLPTRRPSPPVPRPVNMERDFGPNYTPISPTLLNSYQPPPASPVNSANTLAPNVAFHGQQQSTPTRALKTAYAGGFALHQDPAFKRDVYQFFGRAWLYQDPNPKNHDQSDVPTVYKPADDDLAVWRAGLDAKCAVKDNGEGGGNNRMKNLEDAQRQSVLGGLRHKLFNEEA